MEERTTFYSCLAQAFLFTNLAASLFHSLTGLEVIILKQSDRKRAQ